MTSYDLVAELRKLQNKYPDCGIKLSIGTHIGGLIGRVNFEVNDVEYGEALINPSDNEGLGVLLEIADQSIAAILNRSKAEYAKAYPEPVVLMDEAKARKILGGWIDEDDDIFCLGAYISFEKGEETASLDGRFSSEQLEAITWWMRNKQ